MGEVNHTKNSDFFFKKINYMIGSTRFNVIHQNELGLPITMSPYYRFIILVVIFSHETRKKREHCELGKSHGVVG